MKMGSVGSIVKDDRVLRVGIGRQFANVNDALDALSAITYKSTGELSGTVTSVAGSAAITGLGFDDIDPNDYITIGGKDEPVKSIESDNAATLWSGARTTVTGAVATIKKLNPYEIRLYGGHNFIRDVVLPTNGLDLRIVGAPTTSPVLYPATFTEGASRRIVIPNTHTGRVLIDNISALALEPESDTLLTGGGGGLARGIIEINNTFVQDVPLSTFVGGSAIIVKNSELLDSKWHFSGDYGLFEDFFHHGDKDPQDWGFWFDVNITDVGHEFTWNRVTLHNDAPVVNISGNMGFEYNGGKPGKVFRFKNCECIATGVGSEFEGNIPSMFLLWHGGGNNEDYIFEDCTIEAINLPWEISNESNPNVPATFINTFKRDGVTPPVVFNKHL